MMFLKSDILFGQLKGFGRWFGSGSKKVFAVEWFWAGGIPQPCIIVQRLSGISYFYLHRVHRGHLGYIISIWNVHLEYSS